MIRYPAMRNELISYLKTLGDLDYQKKCWVQGIYPTEVEHDELDYVIHFLCDDTDLAKKPKSLVNIILKSEGGAIAIKKYVIL